jgi:hypothetical protein
MTMSTNQITFDKDKATGDPIVVLEGRFMMGDLVTILSQMEKQTGQMPSAITVGSIDVIPIVSAETGEPRVELQSAAFDKPLQMDASESFTFAHALLETTAIAINDAMVFGFISGPLQIPREKAAGMLHAFRGYRDEMLSAGDQETDPR